MPDTEMPDTVEQITKELQERGCTAIEYRNVTRDSLRKTFLLEFKNGQVIEMVDDPINWPEDNIGYSTKLSAALAAREFARAHLKPLNEDDLLKEAAEIIENQRAELRQFCPDFDHISDAFLARIKERK